MDIIDERIKELYGKKTSFCEKNGIAYDTHARLRKKYENWIKQINNYLDPLNLELKIEEKLKDSK